MKLTQYRPDGMCPKCAFPLLQMYRQYNNGEHDIIEDKEVKKCKVDGEHMHLECCCGYELILRPLDWEFDNQLKAAKKKTKTTSVKAKVKAKKKNVKV